MNLESGIKIKEARKAAGMSQESLAKATEGVTVKDISAAERGIKELTPEKLNAIAKTLGVAPESLLAAEAETSAEPTTADAALTAAEKELLELYRNADAGKQSMVMMLLKGEKLDPAFITALPELIKSIDPSELLSTAKDFLFNANIGELLGYVNSFVDFKKIGGSIGQLKSQFGNNNQPDPESDDPADTYMPQSGKEISSALLLFTYLYSSSIYILLLSFYFWLWRTDIKPEQ